MLIATNMSKREKIPPRQRFCLRCSRAAYRFQKQPLFSLLDFIHSFVRSRKRKTASKIRGQTLVFPVFAAVFAQAIIMNHDCPVKYLAQASQPAFASLRGRFQVFKERLTESLSTSRGRESSTIFGHTVSDPHDEVIPKRLCKQPRSMPIILNAFLSKDTGHSNPCVKYE